MASMQSLCKVINTKYTEDDIKLTLISLAQKKQLPFIDMLYYILEDDTPLFFELFGGQLLKIPSKSEFTRANKNIKLFLYIISKRNVENPFKLASYRYNLYLDKIVLTYIDCYESFIMNRCLDEMDIKLEEEDLPKLEKIYNDAVHLSRVIIDNPEENKRYVYKRKRGQNNNNEEKEQQDNYEYCFNNNNDIDDINYNDMLDEESFCLVNDCLNTRKNIDSKNCENNETDDTKQLSLFN